MAIFRVEKTRDYTVMSNHHLKNRALTLKAKGLLSLILSLPDEWDYSLKGLASISVEGIDAIRQGIAELEKQGYIVRERVRDDRGCLRGTEYVIYEQPHLQGASPTAESMQKPVPGPPVQDSPVLESPVLETPTLDNPVLGEPALDNPTQLNTNRSKTYSINKTAAANPNLSNPYPSIPQGENGDAQMGMGKDRDGLAAASFREAIEKRIEYDVLAEDAHIPQGRLDEIVDLMTEVMCAVSDTMTIAGNDYPAMLVQERFRQLGSRHIQYVFECLNKNTSRVRNIKKYLLAVLFNAPSTMDGYYAAKINHDFGVVDLDDFDF